MGHLVLCQVRLSGGSWDPSRLAADGALETTELSLAGHAFGTAINRTALARVCPHGPVPKPKIAYLTSRYDGSGTFSGTEHFQVASGLCPVGRKLSESTAPACQWLGS